jgi:hypothetical protein
LHEQMSDYPVSCHDGSSPWHGTEQLSTALP